MSGTCKVARAHLCKKCTYTRVRSVHTQYTSVGTRKEAVYVYKCINVQERAVAVKQKNCRDRCGIHETY